MEIEQEAATTRRLLERVPEGQLGWRPHPKSMTLGQLALHMAQTQGRVVDAVSADTMELPDFGAQPSAETKSQLLSEFDAAVAHATAGLLKLFDDIYICSASQRNPYHKGPSQSDWIFGMHSRAASPCLRSPASTKRKFRAGSNMRESSTTSPSEIQKLILNLWSKFLTADWRPGGSLIHFANNTGD